MYQSRRDFLRRGIGLLIGAIALHPLEAHADTVYYGKIKDSKKAAYLIFDDVKVKSKYHSMLPEKNDPRYSKILQERNNSIYNSISFVASRDSYDVVVEEGDPKIPNYTDISKLVIERLKEVNG